MGFSFGMVFEIGLEPILSEVSNGHFLPPVFALVATSIFCHRQKMQIESGHHSFGTGHRKRTPAHIKIRMLISAAWTKAYFSFL